MKYCTKCGKEIHDDAAICIYCGCSTSSAKADDRSSLGFAFLGFFFPLVGLILYLVWMNEYPKRAKSAGKGALIGVIVAAFLVVLYFVMVFVLIAIVVSSSPYEILLPLLLK